MTHPRAQKIHRGLGVFGLLLSYGVAQAADPTLIDTPIPNGNFSNGLSDWETEQPATVSSPPPSISVVDGAARIARGGAYVAGLSRQIAAPEGLVALRMQLVQPPALTSIGQFIPDAFDVQLTGADGFTRTATIRPGAAAAANEAAVPAGFVLGDGVTLMGSVLRIPVQGVSDGDLLTLSIALVGATQDSASEVIIDDVILEVLRKQPPPNPDRLNACEFFRDRFDLMPFAPEIPRCWVGQINDTGQLACLGNGDDSCPVIGRSGQDAEFGRDALAARGQLLKLGAGPAGFDYSKLDDNGQVLPVDAIQWQCVVDNHTGLIWEVKLDDPASPRHFDHSFSWRQDDSTINGGSSGTLDGGQCTGSLCDTSALVDAVNLDGLCGASDWRVPTRDELETLIHSGVGVPSMTTDYFPLAGGSTWSWSPAASSADQAWRVDFDTGSVDLELKASALRVRLVREIR